MLSYLSPRAWRDWWHADTHTATPVGAATCTSCAAAQAPSAVAAVEDGGGGGVCGGGGGGPSGLQHGSSAAPPRPRSCCAPAGGGVDLDEWNSAEWSPFRQERRLKDKKSGKAKMHSGTRLDTVLTLVGHESSFGLVLSNSGRIVSVDEESPACRAGLLPLDLVTTINDTPVRFGKIASLVSGKTTVAIRVQRPPTELLCETAAEEAVREWCEWEQAVVSCVTADVDALLPALEALTDLRDEGVSQDPYHRRLTGQEVAAMRAKHGLGAAVRAGDRLDELAAACGHAGIVEVLHSAQEQVEAEDAEAELAAEAAELAGAAAGAEAGAAAGAEAGTETGAPAGAEAAEVEYVQPSAEATPVAGRGPTSLAEISEISADSSPISPLRRASLRCAAARRSLVAQHALPPECCRACHPTAGLCTWVRAGQICLCAPSRVHRPSRHHECTAPYRGCLLVRCTRWLDGACWMPLDGRSWVRTSGSDRMSTSSASLSASRRSSMTPSEAAPADAFLSAEPPDRPAG